MPPIRRQRAHAHAEPRAPLPPQLDTEHLLAWAIGIARCVRSDTKPPLRAGSAEEEELEGVAIEALVELIHRFDEQRIEAGSDPAGAFKKIFGQEIRTRCRRHATTLRHGGDGPEGLVERRAADPRLVAAQVPGLFRRRATVARARRGRRAGRSGGVRTRADARDPAEGRAPAGDVAEGGEG
jgi:hypothetical protein